MGDESTATRRLNLSQAFNPIGSLLGMFCAMQFIQARMSPLDTAERAQLSDAEFEAVKAADLNVLITPYVIVGLVILALFFLIFFTKMPKNGDKDHSMNLGRVLKRIWAIPALPRRSDRTVLLRRGTDHVLDIHHPVRNAGFHPNGHGRTSRRGAFAAL